MRNFIIVTALLLSSQQALAEFVDSVGIGMSPLTLYSRSSLRDTSFPLNAYVLGGGNKYRFDYVEYQNDLPSNIKTRQYNNSAVMGFYNFEFLLRARRGSVLGRSRMYLGVGGGIFRSRLNEVSNVNENNFGYGAMAGFRYFANKQFYLSGEAKYISANLSYDGTNTASYGNTNIGGIFFFAGLGYRFSE